MLEVQKYLENHTLEDLNKEFSIDCTAPKTGAEYDSRIILNYNQITSPKTEQIVRECRGLCLDVETLDIVARAFNRFFNLGEVKGETDKFIWTDSYATHKEDGSLVLLYNWNEQWCVNTRGSFADSTVNGMQFTWKDLFFSALHDHNILSKLNRDYTYVFELCTPYTQIVRVYPEPTIYLLSIFNNKLNWEFHHDYVERVAEEFNFKRPLTKHFQDQFEAVAYIAKIAENDKTFEGVVVRDSNNRRLKIKSDFYLQLHRLSNNGNVASPNRIAEIIMMGEKDEVLTYFPILKNEFDLIGEIIDKMLKDMDNIWFCFHDVTSQKKYADEVKHNPLSRILFDARKLGCPPDKLLMRKEYQDIVVDVVTKKVKNEQRINTRSI